MYDMKYANGDPVRVGDRVKCAKTPTPNKKEEGKYQGTVIEPRDDLYPGFVNVEWDVNPLREWKSRGETFTGINPMALVPGEYE